MSRSSVVSAGIVRVVTKGEAGQSAKDSQGFDDTSLGRLSSVVAPPYHYFSDQLSHPAISLTR